MNGLEKIKIIFSDIDGTILPFTGKDLTASARLIEALCAAGYIFVPCTGRGLHNIPQPLRDAKGIRYVITANGAMVIDLESGETIRERRVSRELAAAITKTAEPFQSPLFSYRNGVHYLERKNGDPEYHRENTSLRDWLAAAIRVDMNEFVQEEESASLDKMGFFSIDEAEKARFLERLDADGLARQLTVSSSADWNLEINAAGGNKGDAAVWLCEKLGFARDEMLTAGDNLNDLSMILAGGISLAPANAMDEVKKAASCVVPDCRDNGVEDFLRQLL